MIGLLLVGGAGGFGIGQWFAEVGRARHDARKVWESRGKWREREGG